LLYFREKATGIKYGRVIMICVDFDVTNDMQAPAKHKHVAKQVLRMLSTNFVKA